jgi:tungstate transport system substrate-binding protein
MKSGAYHGLGLSLHKLLAAVLAALFLATACGGGSDLILATTTSTQDSGLLDVLIPLFEEQRGYRVKTIAVGSGQALAVGEKGEADVLLVHAPKAEEAFMAAGHGINRRLVMHNDFIIVGPAADPAGIRGLVSAAAAFRRIAERGSRFLSRDDDSGTHQKEQQFWKEAGIDPQGRPWYLESGIGMGQTLYISFDKQGYTLSDRGTYLAFRQQIDLNILVEGDPNLLNVYHVLQVNPKQHGNVNAAAARVFVEFMVSPQVQAIIGSFGVEEFGEPLFIPDAHLEGRTPGGS